MKKVLYFAVMLASLSATATTPPKVNEKVIKAFKETFTEAENVNWREFENSCQADFNISEMRVIATYDNEGILLSTTKYYTEKNLPSNILAKLRMKYTSRQIKGVTEVVTESDIAYHIVLKDENYWYWVESNPYANFTLTKRLKNAKPETLGF